MQIKIGNHLVSRDSPPLVIAEMSGNHERTLETALQVVDAAAAAGASAIKLQTFDADSMTIRSRLPAFQVDPRQEYWGGRSLWDLYDEAKTPKEWHEHIFERAKERQILCFSTPFDEQAVDFLERFDPPAYKVASFECTDIPLIRYIASTGRPMIVSVGMASIEEIHRTVDAARESGATQLILLKCTSTYPALPCYANTKAIPALREIFSCEIGFSDHTLGIGSSIAAIAMGASVIEKHLALSRAGEGTDAKFSLEPQEFKSLVTETRNAWEALGVATIGPTEPEKASMYYRRSIFVVKDMRAGEPFTPNNLKRLRPATGLEPRYYNHALGRRAAEDISGGTPLSWNLIADPAD